MKHHERYEARILRVIDYIHANLEGDLSLDTLAEVAAMSRFHWHRVFHGLTGETLADTVRRARLHRAACLLIRTDDPVPAIGRQAGYDHPDSFVRAFRAHYGRSPVAFRSGRTGLALPPNPTRLRSDPMFNVEIVSTRPLSVAGLVHQGAYDRIGGTFEKLSGILGARDLWGSVRGMVGIYYDDPGATAEADLTSHAGFVLADGIAVPEGLEPVTLEGGDYAVLHFRGPYAGLASAYQEMFGAWIPQSGRELRDAPSFERYLNAPADTKPDDLLTDIYVPLAGN